jgi:hypothetical protein
VRAHQLIRRIATLNTTDFDDNGLIELGSWLANEADTLRSALPKGSEVALRSCGKTLLVMIHESLLRDFILTITANVANYARKRLTMEMEPGDGGSECSLRIRFSNSLAGQTPAALPRRSFPDARVLAELAKGMGGRCSMEDTPGGGLQVDLFLPKA